MKLTIDRKLLAEALSSACRIAQRPKKATLAVLAHVLIEGGPGELSITASNLDTSLETSTPATVDKIGKYQCALVPAHKMLEAVQHLGGEELEIVTLANHRVRLTSEGGKVELSGLLPSEFPQLAKPAELDVEIPSVALCHILESVAYAISRDGVEVARNKAGVLLRVIGEELLAIATDGYRLAEASTVAPVVAPEWLTKGVIIPREAVAVLIDAASRCESVRMGSGFAGFARFYAECGSSSLALALINGTFGSHVRTHPAGPLRVQVSSKDLRDATALAMLASSDRVLIDLEKGALKVFAGADLTSASSEVETLSSSGKFMIGVNGDFLTQSLKRFEGVAELCVDPKVDAVCILRDPEDDTHSHMIARFEL